MRPKKHLIERAQANGSIDRLNQLLSASHILLCEANGLLEEAADLMKRNGLLLGELKQLHNQFTNSADRYFREFASMVTTEEQKMDMFSDMDGFDEWFRKWAKIDRDTYLRFNEAFIREVTICQSESDEYDEETDEYKPKKKD